MESRSLLNHESLNHTLDRLAYQVFERHLNVSELALVALQPRGTFLGRRILSRLKSMYGTEDIRYGELDITFHRDDFRRRDEMLVPASTNLDFSLEGIHIILYR